MEAMRKNPKYDNSRIIAACEEALRLSCEGSLNKDRLTRSVKLYNMDFPHANPYRESRDRKGKYLTRQMKILWNFGMDEPVEVRILNCYCPISKIEGTDLQTPLLKEASDVVKNTFSMSADKWLSFIDIMEANKRIFEDSVGPSCRKNAADADKANRQNAAK